MKAADRQTRSYLMELFAKHGLNPRTHLGQNFLIDLNIVEFIVEAADLGPSDVVLEVGAGTGGLTCRLAEGAGAVVSVEIDSNLYQLAQVAIGTAANPTLLNCDVLRTKNHLAPDVLQAVRNELAVDSGRRLKLISNLPYNIATPVVANLVATDLTWDRMVVTIQRELGYRIVARPGKSEYGALSVWIQSQCDVKILKQLPMNVFWPRPKVNSVILRLLPNKHHRSLIDDREFFHDFVRRAFGHRRKLLRSVLASMYRKQLGKPDIDLMLQQAGVDPKARAEQLKVSTLVDLSNRFHSAIRQLSGG